ncbi:unnamed protein product [Schistocephalus solidus]|uniref:Thioredoxin domain-containing protein 17 n=1 Tax=Schistocephalus solidus TaxID=70667 RepID=A0A183T849_SCHSO|nr:unnamed protein product [Schistocephalus solidus]
MAYLHVKELLESLAEHAAKRRFVYFIASPDETGQSWCPDCRRGMIFTYFFLPFPPLGLVALASLKAFSHLSTRPGPNCLKMQCGLTCTLVTSQRKPLLSVVIILSHFRWKDPQNEFRICPELTVTRVPTLLEFGTGHRLIENQITLSSILDMFKQN